MGAQATQGGSDGAHAPEYRVEPGCWPAPDQAQGSWGREGCQRPSHRGVHGCARGLRPCTAPRRTSSRGSSPGRCDRHMSQWRGPAREGGRGRGASLLDTGAAPSPGKPHMPWASVSLPVRCSLTDLCSELLPGLGRDAQGGVTRVEPLEETALCPISSTQRTGRPSLLWSLGEGLSQPLPLGHAARAAQYSLPHGTGHRPLFERLLTASRPFPTAFLCWPAPCLCSTCAASTAAGVQSRRELRVRGPSPASQVPGVQPSLCCWGRWAE